MIQKASKEDYPRLLEIWESAVLATHDFLSEEDFEFYRNRMPKYLENTDIYKFTNIDCEILGFIGVSASSVEMFFIENASRGIGIGKKLISFAINKLHICYRRKIKDNAGGNHKR